MSKYNKCAITVSIVTTMAFALWSGPLCGYLYSQFKITMPPPLIMFFISGVTTFSYHLRLEILRERRKRIMTLVALFGLVIWQMGFVWMDHYMGWSFVSPILFYKSLMAVYNIQTTFGQMTFISLFLSYVFVSIFDWAMAPEAMGDGSEIGEDRKTGALYFASLYVFCVLLISVLGLIHYFVFDKITYINRVSILVSWVIFSSMSFGLMLGVTKKWRLIDTYLGRSMRRRCLILSPLALLYGGGIILFLGCINVLLAPASVLKMKAEIIDAYRSQKPCERIAIRTERIDRILIKICRSQYGTLSWGLPADLMYKEGALGVDYIIGIEIPDLETFQKYYEHIKSPDGLFHEDIFYFMNSDRSEAFRQTVTSWYQRCEKGEGAYCRLAAYVSDIKGKESESMVLLKKACMNNDATACAENASFLKEGQAERSIYINVLIKNCEKEHAESCHELGHVYQASARSDLKEKVQELFVKACKLKSERACRDHF